jgi:hypothetical protein
MSGYWRFDTVGVYELGTDDRFWLVSMVPRLPCALAPTPPVWPEGLPPDRVLAGVAAGVAAERRSLILHRWIFAGQGVGRPGVEPGTRGLKVRCSAS